MTGSPHEIDWKSNTGFRRWALGGGWFLSIAVWAAHSLRVRHSEWRLRTAIISRREAPDCFTRDLSADSVGCVDLYQTETIRSTRHHEGGFDSKSTMGTAIARVSKRTKLEFVGIGSVSGPPDLFSVYHHENAEDTI